MSLNIADVRLLDDKALPLIAKPATVVVLGVAKVREPAGKIECKAFFRSRGFGQVITLDANDWEGCDRIVDLNQPIPDNLAGVADLVIDPGTIEHVFDIRQAFENVCRMLRPGGVAFHHSPLNWVNHGFYNLSPAFFCDAYASNGFDNISVWLRRAKDLQVQAWKYMPQKTMVLPQRRYLINAIARKKNDCPFVLPQQARYSQGHWLGKRQGGEAAVK